MDIDIDILIKAIEQVLDEHTARHSIKTEKVELDERLINKIKDTLKSVVSTANGRPISYDFAVHRAQARDSFKQCMDALWKLQLHHSKIKLLDQQEFEQLILTARFSADEITEVVEEHLQLFDPDEYFKEKD